ncbi:MAG: isoprenyl transferase [Bacteroidales bacterium]|jgi:undecaprenyl diphosphate synthase
MKNLPKHIGIIMDGNGRWATKRGEDRLYGHTNGQVAVEEVIKGSLKLGIKYLTLYAFSKENNKRSKKEVDGLMDLFVSAINENLDELIENEIRVFTIGEIELLPKKVVEKIELCKEKTKNFDKLNVALALNYSSRDELVRTFKRINQDIDNNKITINDIDEQLISSYLDTHFFPDPDLIIRTGGEVRLSNFLLWQSSYAELYFTDILWPDFKESHLIDAVEEYAKRDRRFGKETSK